MSYTLPICEDPVFQDLHTSAFPLSILEADKNFLKLWVLHNFIQVSFERRYGDVLTYKRPFFWLWKCFNVKISLHYPAKNVIKTIKKYLMKGFYVFICVNEKYIPERFAYQVCDNNHELLIYGHDDNRKCFQTIAYNIRDKYERQDISEKDINMAFRASPEHFYKFYALKVRPKTDFQRYNNSLLLKNAQKYLKSAKYEYGMLYHKTKRELGQSIMVDIRSYRTIRDRAKIFATIPQFYSISEETTNLIQENERRGYILFMKILKWNMAIDGKIEKSILSHKLSNSILHDLNDYMNVEMQIIRHLVNTITQG